MRAAAHKARMAQFSMAYIEAMAAAAGVGIATMTPDINGVDVHLESQDDGDQPGYALNVQLKSSSSQISRNPIGDIAYRLEVKEYERLRKQTLIPRLLVLLELPRWSGDWIEVLDCGLLLRSPAWWASVRGEPGSTYASMVPISIPSEDRFTIDVLLGNMRSMEAT